MTPGLRPSRTTMDGQRTETGTVATGLTNAPAIIRKITQAGVCCGPGILVILRERVRAFKGARNDKHQRTDGRSGWLRASDRPAGDGLRYQDCSSRPHRA